MNVRDDSTMKVTPETRRGHEMMTCEVMEMHLYNPNADEEKAFCGEDASAIDRRGVNGYLQRRKDGLEVGTVCEACKALAVPFAVNVIPGLEADGRVDEAQAYRQLANRLARETPASLRG